MLWDDLSSPPVQGRSERDREKERENIRTKNNARARGRERERDRERGRETERRAMAGGMRGERQLKDLANRVQHSSQYECM